MSKQKGFQMPFYTFGKDDDDDHVYLRSTDVVAFLDTLEGVAIASGNMLVTRLFHNIKVNFARKAREASKAGAGVQELRVIDIEEEP